VQLLKYIPLQLIFFQIIGILIGAYLPFTPKFISLGVVISLSALIITYYWARKKIVPNSYFAIFSFLAFIFIGIASITFGNTLYKKNHYIAHLSDKNNRSVLIIDEVLKPNSYYFKYFANVVVLNSEKVQGKVLLNLRKDSITKKFEVDEK